MANAFAVENPIKVFIPTTLGEQIHVMSAKLAMVIDLSNIAQANALKLLLSCIIDTVNNGVTSMLPVLWAIFTFFWLRVLIYGRINLFRRCQANPHNKLLSRWRKQGMETQR